MSTIKDDLPLFMKNIILLTETIENLKAAITEMYPRIPWGTCRGLCGIRGAQFVEPLV